LRQRLPIDASKKTAAMLLDELDPPQRREVAESSPPPLFDELASRIPRNGVTRSRRS
jgi:hypothetical protein